jgi:hypothetical protein
MVSVQVNSIAMIVKIRFSTQINISKTNTRAMDSELTYLRTEMFYKTYVKKNIEFKFFIKFIYAQGYAQLP